MKSRTCPSLLKSLSFVLLLTVSQFVFGQSLNFSYDSRGNITTKLFSSESSPTVPNITSSGSVELCPGWNVTLKAESICNNCEIKWSNGQIGSSIVVSDEGTYTANASNSCGVSQNSNQVKVTKIQIPASTSIVNKGPSTICPGQTTTLAAQNVCSSCTVVWSNGQTGNEITITTAGTYTAYYNTICGKSPVSNPIMVVNGTPPPTPIITSAGPISICNGDSVQLSVSNICNNCTVQWSNGLKTNTIVVKTAGSYSATLLNGCGPSQTSNYINITTSAAPTSPTINLSGSANICDGETTTLTAQNVCSNCTVKWSDGQMGPTIKVSTSGQYSALTVNNCGQSSSSNVVNITKLPPFLPKVLLNGKCFLSGPNGANYQWYLNSVLIPGATSQFWTAMATGFYKVSMTDLSNCKGTSEPVFAEPCGTATTETDKNSLIVVYPNPFENNINLTYLGPENLTDLEVELLSNTGVKITKLISVPYLESGVVIDLKIPSSLPNGLYILKITSKDTVSVHRVAKQM